jgi:hypothetical protein
VKTQMVLADLCPESAAGLQLPTGAAFSD